MAEYTTTDAKNNMNDLVDGLKAQYDQLSSYMQTLPSLTQQTEVNNLRSKLSLEIHHRELMAAFDEAAATVIRPPAQAEVDNLQNTLRDLNKSISAIADFQAVVGFIENVMTETAQSFNDIVATIST